MTQAGLEALGRVQAHHGAAVRDVHLQGLGPRGLDRLGQLCEKGVPGVISEPVWPPRAGFADIPARGRHSLYALPRRPTTSSS